MVGLSVDLLIGFKWSVAIMNIVRMVGRVNSGLLAWVGTIVGCCVSAGIYAQTDSMSQNWPYSVDDLGIENTKLTPLGALREGSDDGTIPAWSGGLVEFPRVMLAVGQLSIHSRRKSQF